MDKFFYIQIMDETIPNGWKIPLPRMGPLVWLLVTKKRLEAWSYQHYFQ